LQGFRMSGWRSRAARTVSGPGPSCGSVSPDPLIAPVPSAQSIDCPVAAQSLRN
jgi:hypothetical protein